MTYQTKKQLREQIQELKSGVEQSRQRGYKLEDTIDELVSAAERLGLQVQYKHHGDGEGAYTISLPEGAILQTRADRDEYAMQLVQAREDARREALQTVIEALGLKDYGYHEPSAFHFSLTSADSYADRLWKDLQTALDVRAQRKAQADAEATEKLVSKLGKKPEGGLFSLTFKPVSLDDDPDPEFVENTVAAVKLADAAERTKKASKKSKDRP